MPTVHADRAEALRRDVLDKLLEHLRVGVVGRRGVAVNNTRGNSVHAHTFGRPLHGEGLGQVIDGRSRSALILGFFSCATSAISFWSVVPPFTSSDISPILEARAGFPPFNHSSSFFMISFSELLLVATGR